MKTKHPFPTATVLLLLFLSPVSLFAEVGPPEVAVSSIATDAALWKDAGARIEKYRKSDVEIAVVDTQGKPIPDAMVQVAQTDSTFLFGANIFMWGWCGDAKRDEAYKRQYADIFNFATLAFYWWSYEPEKGKTIHDHWMDVAKWCNENGIKTKGHPLAWNFFDPAWLPNDSNEIFKLQLARIDDCVSLFKGTTNTWDVVNELTHYDRRYIKVDQAPKTTRMIDEVGPAKFAQQCFLEARKANPDTTLLINDYRTDEAYERVIENLVDDQGKRLYDVIGLQSHLLSGVWPNHQIWETCERFAKYGVPIHFTETTIPSGILQENSPEDKKWISTPEEEKRQAEEVVRFYTMLFSHPAVEAISWWDISDYSGFTPTLPGLLRADMSPKPAYVALRDLIRRKWRTNVEVKTNADGIAKFRAFHGDYKIAVETPQGEKKTQTAHVLKGEKNRITVAF